MSVTSLYDGYLAMAGPISVRPPREGDASVAHRIVTSSPPLDVNSLYAYLLQSWHFPDTCALAEIDEKPAGYISAYIPPRQPDTLFIWQVAVLSAWRGHGVSRALVLNLLARESCSGVRFIDTTVTRGNTASDIFFRKLALELDADLSVSERLPANLFAPHIHDAERLFRIGPIGHQPLESGLSQQQTQKQKQQRVIGG